IAATPNENSPFQTAHRAILASGGGIVNARAGPGCRLPAGGPGGPGVLQQRIEESLVLGWQRGAGVADHAVPADEEILRNVLDLVALLDRAAVVPQDRVVDLHVPRRGAHIVLRLVHVDDDPEDLHAPI